MPSSPQPSNTQRACAEDVPRPPKSVGEGTTIAADGDGTVQRLEVLGAQRIENGTRDNQILDQANSKERLQVDMDVREEAQKQGQGPDQATRSVNMFREENRRDTVGT